MSVVQDREALEIHVVDSLSNLHRDSLLELAEQELVGLHIADQNPSKERTGEEVDCLCEGMFGDHAHFLEDE
jgi:hypothetical protein